MSFDINPSKNLSNVQASHKSNDGGAGNTGYFRRKGKNEEEEINLAFAKEDSKDSFSKEDVVFEEEETESLTDIIKKIFKDFINSIKNLFKKQE